MPKKTGRAASKARRAAQKSKQQSSSSKSTASPSKASTTAKYETTDGRRFTDKADATEHQRKLNAAGKGRETTNVKEKKEEEVADDGLSYDELIASSEYNALPKDQQEVVRAVFGAIGANNVESAKRLVSAFEAAEKLADPFFKQQIRLAKDAVERGFVAVDQELEFEKMQAERRLQDLRTDIETQSEYLTLEETNDLKSLEREYKQNLDTTRQNLAATGMSSSSIRAEKEQILEDVTGDLRESTQRRFGYQRSQLRNQLTRNERDVSSEIARLTEVAKQNKTTLFRQAEEKLGSGNLPSLNFDVKPLGNVIGSIEQDRQNDVIGAVKNLIF